MKGMFISVKSEKFEIEVPINGRISYLRGDSGEGKTTFSELVKSSISDKELGIEVEVPSGYTADVLDSTRLIDDIKSRRKTIIIIDDNLGTEKPHFPKVVMNILKEIDSFLIIINRVDAFENSLLEDDKDSLDYNALCILWIEKNKNSIKRVVKPLLTCFDSVGNYNNVTDIWCEDTFGMNYFCNSYNERGLMVHYSEGRDNVVKDLETFTCEGDLFVYVDLIRFGQRVSDLYGISMNNNINIVLDPDFLSFEYFILRTNIFRDIELPKGVDVTEKTYELLLAKVSLDKIGHNYKHAYPVPICLLRNCECCKRYPRYCDKILDGDKLSHLVDETEFQYMEKLLRG